MSADSSGCEWYRIALPLRVLSQRYGHSVGYGRLLTAVRVAPDVLIGQRVANPAPSRLWQALAGAGRAGPAVLGMRYFDVPQWVHDVLAEKLPRPALVYELDDDLFNVEPSNPGAHEFFGKPETRRLLEANMSAADLVTVSTEALAAVVREHTATPVRVIANAVPDWLPELGQAHLPSRPDRQRTVIGWAGGPSHRADVTDAQAAVRRFMMRSPATELHTIGMPWPGLSLGATDERTRHSPWASSVEQFYSLLDFDIGLAPLRPSIFNRSKSAIKVMEYQALGIVPVASNVGPYADYLSGGELGTCTGILIDRPHQWTIALRELVEMPEARAKIARAGWEQVQQHTISRRAPEWQAAIEEARHAVVQ